MIKSSIGNFIMLFLLMPCISFAQMTNLVFFTEQGERFSVVLNGVLQNDQPETNIKITGLPAPSYKLKVIFADPKIPELDKTLMFQQNTETTFNIKKNNKGEYVVRFLNSIPIEQVLPPTPEQHIFVYTTVPPSTTVINQTQINSTTINNTNSGSQGNVSMNINAEGSSTSISTSTTTVTASSSAQPASISDQGSGNVPPHPDHPDHYVMPGYNGPIGCPYPMTDLDFADVKRSIESKSFEDSKLTIAKEVTSANCLFASEVKEIMMLFDFESTRLTYAKFAWDYTFDKGNYYKVNDAFQFESSIDELRQYIHKDRK
jgi:hypothetical protein